MVKRKVKGDKKNGPQAPDQKVRDQIVVERGRNVVVDAGAGSGKTSTLVRRYVDLIAPRKGENRPYPTLSVAAITFTRKAAGELRFRIRDVLIRELGEETLARRRGNLQEALSQLDTAYIGTIHSFAERLLRMRPMEAGLSPRYEIAEDTAELARETFERLIRGVETGTLADEVEPEFLNSAKGAIENAEHALTDYMSAGFPIATRDFGFASVSGLDEFVKAVLEKRDTDCDVDDACDMDAVGARVEEFCSKVGTLNGNSLGTRWLKQAAKALKGINSKTDPRKALRTIRRALFPVPKYQKGADFEGDSGWAVYKQDYDANPGDRVAYPLHQWMAARLVKTIPVISSIYERVKERHEVVDHIDLLIKLRTLLRDDLTVRKEFGELFRHILVDEFQDTDPLQAEIIFYLLDAQGKETDWGKVHVRSGALTIVGDPKQSIYRFRRADISTYDLVCCRLIDGGAFHAALEANFRSRKGVIDFVNDRFPEILGKPETGEKRFDPESGRVFYQALRHMVPEGEGCPIERLGFSGEGTAEECRRDEADALARRMRHLVESRFQVRDPATNTLRDVSYGDLAVLARVTTNIRLLEEAFDRYNVPHTARGGKLFLEDPLVRQFILAIRAIEDATDGPAQAALRRPPFLAIDPADLLAVRTGEAPKTAETKEAVKRSQRVEEVIGNLVKKRFERTPGETAWELLERSDLAETVRLGRNGPARLSLLREVIFEMERIAHTEGLDFAGVTGRMRGWVERPAQLDPPDLSGGEAVRIMTIFQAKGLEFPVVALWDGIDKGMRPDPAVWVIDRLGGGWALALNDIKVEWPKTGVRSREEEFEWQQYSRLLYVAATRARDLLILPFPAGKSEKMNESLSRLVVSAPQGLIENSHAPDMEPAPPFGVITVVALPAPISRDALEVSSRPEYVTALVQDEGGERKDIRGRYGKEFGTVVHGALDLLLSGATASPDKLVAAVAASTGMTSHLKEAVGDVERAYDTLKMEGLLEGKVRTEVPLIRSVNEGRHRIGIIDLLSELENAIIIIDFKTGESRPEYFTQLKLYVEMLKTGNAAKKSVRAGILLTESGKTEWLK